MPAPERSSASSFPRPALAGWLLLAAVVLLAGGLVDARTRMLAGNTLFLAAGSCLIALPLGGAAAWLLVRTNVPGRLLFAGCWGGMLLVPLYLQAAGWDAGFGRQGWHSLIFGSFAEPWLRGWQGAIWVHGMAAAPGACLLVGLGLGQVDRNWEEEGLLHGSGLEVFFAVTLRALVPWLGAAALWCLASVASEIAVTDLFQTPTFAEEIYLTLSLGTGWDASTLHVGPSAALLAGMTLLLLGAAVGLPPGDQDSRPPQRLPLGAFRLPAFLLLLLLTALLLGAPLGNLIYKAGALSEMVDGELVRSWSPGKTLKQVFGAFFLYRREFGATLGIGAGAATLAILVVAPWAWWGRTGGLRAVPGLLLTSAALAIPGPLVGLAVIGLLNQDSPWFIWLYDRTLAAPILAAAFRGAPFAFLLCWQGMRTLAPHTLEAAAADGASSLRQFWSIGLRHAGAAIAAAWLAAATVASGDLAATILVSPPGVDPLSRRIFGLIHAGVDDQVAAASLAAWLLAAGLTILLLGLIGFWRPEKP
ncbi:ABC transporter permease [Lignipirellula cremea]|uniref:Putrescine transporter subunit: membrane component of ABC superfamily protein n=1 Tax=Lignipirellula cremea TaxID=2528010 RepID=A0A518E2R0_9BACT|nr:ABC transporter permease subunit [Lignipirellula cremea]QDU98375.1 putrescine transporter subunit: membrane component of ABC superfamily protein [Lignipirellula cremea]